MRGGMWKAIARALTGSKEEEPATTTASPAPSYWNFPKGVTSDKDPKEKENQRKHSEYLAARASEQQKEERERQERFERRKKAAADANAAWAAKEKEAASK